MSLQDKIIAVVSEVLEVPADELKPETRFVEDLAVSSLQLVDVVWRLEEVLQLPETSPNAFSGVHTVRDMVELVEKARESAPEDPVVGGKVDGSKERVFDVAFASDHAGVKLKGELAELLRRRNYLVADLGPQTSVSVDYPEFADKVTDMILEGKARFGVLICGSGVGMSMAANRKVGIRAALVSEPTSAKLSRKHNNANVICLGARLIGTDAAEACLDAFLTSAFDPGSDGRHRRRICLFDSRE